MEIIAIANQKGGCGKTTTAINLSACLGQRGKRTLVVDMDPQGHASLGFGLRCEEREGLYEVFLREITMGEVIVPEVSKNVDLVPGTISLAAVEHLLADTPEREWRLATHLSQFEGRYDYCVIDCPPSLGLLAFNALRAADRVLVPLEMSAFALDGIERLSETIDLLAEKYQTEIPIRVLPTMVDLRPRFSREMMREVREMFPQQLSRAAIHYTIRLKEAAQRGVPVVAHDAECIGALDYDRLAREVMGEEVGRVTVTAFNAYTKPRAGRPVARGAGSGAMEVAAAGAAAPQPEEAGEEDDLEEALEAALAAEEEKDARDLTPLNEDVPGAAAPDDGDDADDEDELLAGAESYGSEVPFGSSTLSEAALRAALGRSVDGGLSALEAALDEEDEEDPTPVPKAAASGWYALDDDEEDDEDALAKVDDHAYEDEADDDPVLAALDDDVDQDDPDEELDEPVLGVAEEDGEVDEPDLGTASGSREFSGDRGGTGPLASAVNRAANAGDVLAHRSEVEPDRRDVVLRFKGLAGCRVQVAGDFNGWIPDRGIHTKRDGSALLKTLKLIPGEYQYRVVVDGVWQEDPGNPDRVPNIYGGSNSLLRVPPPQNRSTMQENRIDA